MIFGDSNVHMGNSPAMVSPTEVALVIIDMLAPGHAVLAMYNSGNMGISMGKPWNTIGTTGNHPKPNSGIRCCVSEIFNIHLIAGNSSLR